MSILMQVRKPETPSAARGHHAPPPDQQTCSRCQGLLVDDLFMDMEEGGLLWEPGRRCLNCGNIVFAGRLHGLVDPGRASTTEPGNRENAKVCPEVT